ncbi:hypothetical protein CBS470a_011580 [Colletotrichum nupharicola]|nr:hypothetical protein CBS470a_011580 [Colletotrichum nupharicola]
MHGPKSTTIIQEKEGADGYGPAFATAVPNCPATYRRPPAVNAGRTIEAAGVAHANYAPSVGKPRGSEDYSENLSDYTVLQQHVLFWDRDNDGVITPIDVWVGFRDLGFNIPTCLLACTVIPFAFSYGTVMQHSYLPDPFFRLYVDGMHKAKWIASFFEWVTTWMLLADDGKVHKEDLRRVYDGSLFWDIREKRRSGEGWKQGWGLGGDGFIGYRKRIGIHL